VTASPWVGTEERGGRPIPARPDVAPPPHWRLEAIAATERPRQLALAPDRTQAAFILDRDTSDVWTVDTRIGAVRRVTTHRGLMPYWEDSAPAWSPDGSLVAYDDGGALWVAPAAGGPPRRLCEGSSPAWLAPGRVLGIVDRDGWTRLVAVDVDDPWPVPLTPPGGECWAPSVSPDATSVAYVFGPDDDRGRSEIHVVDVASAKDRALTGLPGTRDAVPVWSPDATTIAFVSERPGWYEIFTIGRDGGDERRLTDAGADFGGLAWNPDGASIAATRTRHGVGDLVTVDAATGAVTEVAAGGTWAEPQWLSDGSILATYEDAATAPQLRIVTPDGEQRVLLAPTPAPVVAAPHVRPEHVTFRSFDGLEVHGLLYRPAGASAEHPAAAIVNPHGGPTSHDGDEWFGHAQYFVDKGYAWLLVNFRGSTSFGREYEAANHGVWGVADTQDCLAAHDFLASLDWVDATRVGIYGASYGSYMSLCAVVDDPAHRFRCAVMKFGDSDVLVSWAQGDRTGRFDLERMMRHPSAARAAYETGSPIHRIENLEAPVLVAHGERDERVHPAQSRDLVDALKSLGKTFEYVTYPSEAHGFLSAGPQVDFFRRLERFLDWCLLPEPRPT
jgi:dipeptidyl aminopeptidase/acylaminoacyl peptidase